MITTLLYIVVGMFGIALVILLYQLMLLIKIKRNE